MKIPLANGLIAFEFVRRSGPDNMTFFKHHVTIERGGHYGVFSGRRWRKVVYPEVRRFIADADADARRAST